MCQFTSLLTEHFDSLLRLFLPYHPRYVNNKFENIFRFAHVIATSQDN